MVVVVVGCVCVCVCVCVCASSQSKRSVAALRLVPNSIALLGTTEVSA